MTGPVEALEAAVPIERGGRVDVYGRVLIGDRHLDVRAEYWAGPVPCIVERERYLVDELLPLTVRMLDEVQRSIVAEEVRR